MVILLSYKVIRYKLSFIVDVNAQNAEYMENGNSKAQPEKKYNFTSVTFKIRQFKSSETPPLNSHKNNFDKYFISQQCTRVRDDTKTWRYF